MVILTLADDPTVTAQAGLLSQFGTFSGQLFLHLTGTATVPSTDVNWIPLAELLAVFDLAPYGRIVDSPDDPTVTPPSGYYAPGTIVRNTSRGAGNATAFMKISDTGTGAEWLPMDGADGYGLTLANLLVHVKQASPTQLVYQYAFEVDLAALFAPAGGETSTQNVGAPRPPGAMLVACEIHIKDAIPIGSFATLTLSVGDDASSNEASLCNAFDALDGNLMENKGQRRHYRPISQLNLTATATGDTLDHLAGGVASITLQFAIP